MLGCTVLHLDTSTGLERGSNNEISQSLHVLYRVWFRPTSLLGHDLDLRAVTARGPSLHFAKPQAFHLGKQDWGTRGE